MKIRSPLLKISTCLALIALAACHKMPGSTTTKAQTVIQSNDSVRLHPLSRLHAVGDFDGDGTMDSLVQHYYSKRTKTEFTDGADPFGNEWEQVVEWFYEQDADVYLATNRPGQEQLHFGTVLGLYCLINVGDNNGDGRDEIAVVVDKLDYSRVNACRIYSLCGNEWALLMEFGIYEGAFDFRGKMPVFKEIREYLEKKEGQWVYLDYTDYDGYDTQEEVGKMKPISPGKCK